MSKRGKKKERRPPDDDIVSLQFAPRFKEGLRLGGCLLIHHTPVALDLTHSNVSPARRRVCARSCHACVPPLLFSLSLSERISGLSAALGPRGQTFRSGAPFFSPPRPRSDAPLLI